MCMPKDVVLGDMTNMSSSVRGPHLSRKGMDPPKHHHTKDPRPALRPTVQHVQDKFGLGVSPHRNDRNCKATGHIIHCMEDL